MPNKTQYDLTYVTIDSISEGVGSSQIKPLISRLSSAGLKINLISFEKLKPSSDSINYFDHLGVNWSFEPFGANGIIGGFKRLDKIRKEIGATDLIHARSDIPAVAAVLSGNAPVLWDVRSLWSDQKVIVQDNPLNKSLYRTYRQLESFAARRSEGMSTLTNAVVPILEQRNKTIPKLRTVVPTAVDLQLFEASSIMPKNKRALFSGTYNDYYDLEFSSLFIKELRKLVPLEVHWARPQESRRYALGVGENSVLLASQTEMAQLIPNYSFGISICKFNAGVSLAAAVPTKIGEFLACGRPIVVNKGLGDMDELLNEFDAGVILDGDSHNLKNAALKLIDLLDDPETPERCKALAEKYFSMESGVSKYLSIYTKISKII
jgi:glycosyltransferase involved in cell wall biosynthesis